jgi:hypothetical protein
MSRVPDPMNFFNLSNVPAALGPGVHSASDRNEYQKQKCDVSWGYSAAGG